LFRSQDAPLAPAGQARVIGHLEDVAGLLDPAAESLLVALVLLLRLDRRARGRQADGEPLGSALDDPAQDPLGLLADQPLGQQAVALGLRDDLAPGDEVDPAPGSRVL